MYLDLGSSNSGSAGSSSSSLLDIMNRLYLSNAQRALQGVQALVLRLPKPAAQDAHKAYAMYQYLYQELGFLGYFHGMEMAVEEGGESEKSGAGVPHNNSGVVLKLGLARQRQVSSSSVAL
jgi:hypothetical protein